DHADPQLPNRSEPPELLGRSLGDGRDHCSCGGAGARAAPNGRTRHLVLRRRAGAKLCEERIDGRHLTRAHRLEACECVADEGIDVGWVTRGPVDPLDTRSDPIDVRAATAIVHADSKEVRVTIDAK